MDSSDVEDQTEKGPNSLEAVGGEDDEARRLWWEWLGGAGDGEEGREGLSRWGDALAEVDGDYFRRSLDRKSVV